MGEPVGAVAEGMGKVMTPCPQNQLPTNGENHERTDGRMDERKKF